MASELSSSFSGSVSLDGSPSRSTFAICVLYRTTESTREWTGGRCRSDTGRNHLLPRGRKGKRNRALNTLPARFLSASSFFFRLLVFVLFYFPFPILPPFYFSFDRRLYLHLSLLWPDRASFFRLETPVAAR